MKVVFLDIDGVLNSRNRWEFGVPISENHRIDPATLVHLNEIARGCSVVVSSAWRFSFEPEDLRERLIPLGLDSTIPFIGRTTKRNVAIGRGRKILDWVVIHARTVEWDIAGFVVLDDNGGPEMDVIRTRLVQTKFKYGLQHSHVSEALMKLSIPWSPV